MRGRIRPEEAQAALGSVEAMTDAGLRRGLYPRWYAAAVAAWAGLVAAAVGAGPEWILPLAGLGALGWALRRKTAGAGVREIHNRRDLSIVIALSAVVCLLMFAGPVARQALGLSWAPYAAGCAVAVLLFSIMEASWRRTRRRLKAWRSI